MSTREVPRSSGTTSNPSEEESLDVLVLPPKIQRFVQLWMTGQYTQAKLAQLLEVTPMTIRTWLKREDVQNAIAEFSDLTNKMVATQLTALTTRAVHKLGELVDSPIDGVAYQAVRDILDRGGHKAKQEIKVDKTVTTVEQKLQSLIDQTITVDAEIVEVDEDGRD